MKENVIEAISILNYAADRCSVGWMHTNYGAFNPRTFLRSAIRHIAYQADHSTLAGVAPYLEAIATQLTRIADSLEVAEKKTNFFRKRVSYMTPTYLSSVSRSQTSAGVT